MALRNVSGQTLRKMVMKATGTKGYLSSSVQKHMQDSGQRRFIKEGTKVTRKQATQIMRGLKEGGLARKVTSDPTSYTKKAFAQEERRQEMIKQQNIAEHAKEIAAEKTAEETAKAKSTSASSKQSVKPAALAATPTLKPRTSSSPSTAVGVRVAHTNLKPSSSALIPIPKNLKPIPPNTLAPKKEPPREEEVIDLAID